MPDRSPEQAQKDHVPEDPDAPLEPAGDGVDHHTDGAGTETTGTNFDGPESAGPDFGGTESGAAESAGPDFGSPGFDGPESAPTAPWQIDQTSDAGPHFDGQHFDGQQQYDGSQPYGSGPSGSGPYGSGPSGSEPHGSGQPFAPGQHGAGDQPYGSQPGAEQGGSPYSPQPYGGAPAYGQDAAAQAPYAPSGDQNGTPSSFSQDPYGPASAAAGGGSVPQPAPAPGYAPTDPAATRARGGKKPRASKLPLILSLSAVGVVLALVVVGALVVMNMNRTQYGPETVAQEYLDSVAAGDLAAAQEVTTASVPNGANEALVTPEVFAASASAIEDVSVGEASINGDVATMAATYTLGGQQYELPLTAEKSGRQGVFFDQWTLTPPVLQTLSLNLTQTAGATINGEPVDLATGATEYAVMPGAYELVVPGSKYTEEGSAAITVGFAPDEAPQPAALNVTINVTEAYKEDVIKAVMATLDECLESGALETECGFFKRDTFQSERERETYDTLKKDGVEYEMTKEPTIVVTDYGATATGSFYTDGDNAGSVEATVETDEGREYELTSDLHPAGTVQVNGDTIEITFFYNG